jgi:hypothetical protein
MNHCLLVSGLVVAKLWRLLQGLANTSHIAVAKNAKATGEELIFVSVALDVLVQ